VRCDLKEQVDKTNKVATAPPLDIAASSLPDRYKEQLLKLNDQRITKEGVIVIKAQEHRSQEQNRRKPATAARFDEERDRPKPRKPSQPT